MLEIRRNWTLSKGSCILMMNVSVCAYVPVCGPYKCVRSIQVCECVCVYVCADFEIALTSAFLWLRSIYIPLPYMVISVNPVFN